MDFNEYIPKGGWKSYYKRKEFFEKLKEISLIILLIAAYLLCGYIELH